MESKRKIVDLSELETLVFNWKEKKIKLVFTNGCFDLLHLGHIDYLEKASQKGDKLIIGVNTDASVSRIKGETRPITNQYSRSRILAALEFVDAVILFDEETPFDLISIIKPDVLVKGDDYKIENIVGAEIVMNNGGKVETIEFIEGYSTSKIIEKIKNE